jgi:hypothetical protein
MSYSLSGPAHREGYPVAIVDTVKRALGITAAHDRKQEAAIKAEKTVESMERLEDSQQALIGAIRDTGFFLGDALTIERAPNDRRASHHHH